MLTTKKRGLGKGLGDLGLTELLSDINTVTATPVTETSANQLGYLTVESLQPGRYQPRKDMDPEALQELANSIRSQGIIQPIVVRSVAPQRYEIIAGERRWRAAQIAGLTEVPVVIREIPDEAAMAMALIENIQREDLNPIEEATALQRLIEEFDMSHQDIAEIVGKARATVSNLLRLLNLNTDVKKLLEHNDLEMGHAKALLALEGEDQSHAAKTIVSKGLSVRETEKLITKFQTHTPAVATKSSPDPDVLRLQQGLSDKLGAAVTVQHQAKGNGKIVIHYNNLDELEGILDRIN